MKLSQLAFFGGLASAAVFSASCAHQQTPSSTTPESSALRMEGETRFGKIRQLTHGGTNAEAYWSFDGKWLTFQRKGGDLKCDQIFAMRPDGSDLYQVSNGKGRTTCSYFFPDNSRILFSSTFHANEGCPREPDRSQGYVWPIYPTYQMYSVKNDPKAIIDAPEGKDLLPLEPGAPRAYNAEATACKDGSIVFTSDRDGDLELYVGKLDGNGTLGNIKRITNTPGYDGGAFFSPDCKQIVWRASRPKPGKELEDYQALLQQHLVRPSKLEIWVADADGSHAHQVTRLGAASFAPFFTPDGRHILFSTNVREPKSGKFDIHRVSVSGTRLEQVTHANGFDGFPMFSPDGKSLAFSSNRNSTDPHEINVFVADWIEQVDPPLSLDDADAANRFYALVEKLADDRLEGRGIGTPGLVEAAKIVAERFAAIGLKPFFDVFKRAVDGKGYFHKAEIRIARDKIVSSENVLGVYGNGCSTRAPVILGAHLDHLGTSAENSLEPGKKGIHHGADDNASGVAAVLEAARIIQKDRSAAKGCFVFAAFTGEEVGIGGSSRLAELLKKMNVKPKAMLNFDMVGRLENNKLIVYGTDSATQWKGLVERECSARGLACPGGGDGYGPSDHMAFYVNGSPVLHFFTGPHLDYHRVSDTLEKINATGGVQVAEVAAALALKAASPSQPLTFVKAAKAPSMGKMKKGNGAYLGTIPDYSSMTSPHGLSGAGAEGGGVKLSGVRPGSPADQAGVKGGDILMALNEYDAAGKEVRHRFDSLEGFMQVLVTLKPGQRVIMEVKREGKVLQLPTVVGKRE